MVQEHAARRHHFDFRLEHDGVLVSFAVPKNVPLEPGEKRLAVRTDDHPLAYAEFEGTIPEGEYGAGEVVLWDRGSYELVEWNDEEKIEVVLHGNRLEGKYALVRFRKAGKNDWLLLKAKEG
ncbi:ATP-dependent DNA ligase [Methanomicrobiaceae archaeon CYW5]|nr:ATP-dependent DNA ligase [Methanovulcanius yangii]